MKKYLLLIFALTFLSANYANAQNNTVYVMAGTAHNERTYDVKVGSPTVSIIYERLLSEKWNLDTTITYSADRNKFSNKGHTLIVSPFIEYFPTKKVFVGAGVQITKNNAPQYGNEVYINPTFEAGLVLPYKRVTFEPYVQGGTPDLNLKTRYSNIGGGANIYITTKKNQGVRLSGYGFQNFWKNGDGSRGRGVATGLLAGYYFKF